MASVILPTFKWMRSCEQLARQLDPDDELLVVCDSDDDPVTTADLPAEADLFVAGGPEGCSGKANAVALEHASHTVGHKQLNALWPNRVRSDR